MNDKSAFDPSRIQRARERRFPFSRREFLGAISGVTAGAAGFGLGAELSTRDITTVGSTNRRDIEPFYGTHQGGITTSGQSHTYFAALDVTTDERHELVKMLRNWTAIASNLTTGKTAVPMTSDPEGTEPDSGDTLDLGPARLTINIGFGPSLFGFDGPDRFGLANELPMQLVSLPAFPGDQMAQANIGGDLTIQACADDPQVAFHAVRQLVRAAVGVASMLVSGGLQRGSRHQRDPEEFDRLQRRNVQPQNRCGVRGKCMGGGRGTTLDGGRDVRRDPEDQNLSLGLGRPVTGVPGAGHRAP